MSPDEPSATVPGHSHQTVRQLLDALGFSTTDHDTNVRDALTALLERVGPASGAGTAECGPARPGDDVSAEDLLFSDVANVLCRVFDDFDEAMDEWRDWYVPSEWLHGYRALGAFVRMRLDRRAEATAPLRLAAERVSTFANHKSGCSKGSNGGDYCTCGLDGALKTFQTAITGQG